MSDISLRRHLFTEAFAYDMNAKNKPKKTIIEITHLIPGISAVDNSYNFIESLKERIQWESDTDLKSSRFDESFSNYRLFRYFVHAIGLGILFIPLRLAATYMKSYDEKYGRTCPYDSPYHPSLDSNYVNPKNFQKPSKNQMFDFEVLRKHGVDPDEFKNQVINKLEYERWKSQQNR